MDTAERNVQKLRNTTEGLLAEVDAHYYDKALKEVTKVIEEARKAYRDNNISKLTDLRTDTGRQQIPGFRFGRRIPVQVTATARRSSVNSRGRRAINAGRPGSTASGESAPSVEQAPSASVMPPRKKRKVPKRAHNLSENVAQNKKNGGQ